MVQSADQVQFIYAAVTEGLKPKSPYAFNENNQNLAIIDNNNNNASGKVHYQSLGLVQKEKEHYKKFGDIQSNLNNQK